MGGSQRHNQVFGLGNNGDGGGRGSGEERGVGRGEIPNYGGGIYGDGDD